MANKKRYILEIHFVYFFACLLNVGSIAFFSLGAIARLTEEVNTVKVATCEVTKCVNSNKRAEKKRRMSITTLSLVHHHHILELIGKGWKKY